MNTHDASDAFDITNPDELAELERRWRGGQLQEHTQRVLRFAAQHRDEILQLAGRRRDAAALLQATQSLICEHGSINHGAEAQEELREMHNYLWFEGEKGHHNRVEILSIWATIHAPNWRRWMIKQYMFIAERCSSEIATRFAASETTEHAVERCSL